MTDPLTATCPQCLQPISPEDTIVYGFGVLGHLDCRRPRVLSADERTLPFIYCRDHPVAQCVRCTVNFYLREIASLDQFSIRSHECPWCYADMTDSIRTHVYGCALVPAKVRRRAQAARDAARSLVKRSLELCDAADVAIREAEAAVYALRQAIRESPNRPRVGGSAA